MRQKIHSHEVGLCTKVNDDAIVWIPKCGTTVFRSYDSVKYNYHDYNVKQYWVMLRDPYSRWKSGIGEYAFRNPEKEEEILDTIDTIEFDEHTTPQTKFLTFTEKLEFPTQYFLLEREGMEKLNSQLKLFDTDVQTGRQVLYTSIYNISFVNMSKLFFLKKLDGVLSKSLISKVDEYYHDDYMLIKNNISDNSEFSVSIRHK